MDIGIEKQHLKTIVIYYSFEGNTRLIAEIVAKTVNADILELKPKNEIKSRGFMKYLQGGGQVIKKEGPELHDYQFNQEEYDLIFIGTPVWAFSYAPAFTTFFSENKIKDKKIALFCCDSGQKGKTFKNMKKALEENDIIDEIEFLDPLKKDEECIREKAKKWAEEVIKTRA